MERIGMEEFLSHFGDVALRARPEQGRDGDIPTEGKVKWSESFSSDVLIKLNEKYPYCLEFTPNGNFGSRCREHNKVTPKNSIGKGWNSFVVDIDLKDFTGYTMDTLRAKIEKDIMEYSIPYTFIVTSGQGYHLYWVIEKNSRSDSYETYAEDINKYLAMLLGGDMSATKIGRWMRLPGSYHWKNDKKETFVEYNEGVFLTKEAIDNAIKYIKDEVKLSNDEPVRTFGVVMYDSVNNIPFSDICSKLSSYPKNGYFPVLVNDTAIAIQQVSGKRIPTSGWKYNKEGNYVNNFTDHHYSIYDRPRGGMYHFLYYWFDGNQVRLAEFLKKEYSIDLLQFEGKQGEVAHMQFEEEGKYTLIFTNKRVLLQFISEKGKREYTVLENNIIIKGIYEYENEGKIEKGILAVYDDNNITIPYYPTKKKWNEKLGKHGLHFFGSDDDCGHFHRIITNNKELPVMETATLNGMFDTYTMLGGTLIHQDAEIFPMPISKFPLHKGKQISAGEYYAKVSSIFAPEISAVSFCQVIALAGMNLWEDYTRTNCYPALLLTGTTRTGKTTLRKILRSAVGYLEEDRTISLPDVTPKPLRELARDNAILSLEELTGNVRDGAESLLRNIVNHEEGRLGTVGDTIIYKFGSPLFVCGERGFKDESLRNRFVTCCMLEKYKIGSQAKLRDIDKYTCYQHIYDVYKENKNRLDDYKLKWMEFLESNGYDARMAEVYSYVFIVNDLFEINIPVKHLLDYVAENFSLSSESADYYNNKETPELLLKQILTEGLMTRKVMLSYNHETNTYDCFFHRDYKEKQLININKMIRGFMEHQDDGDQRLSFFGTSLQVRIKKTESLAIDFVLDKIMEEVYIRGGSYSKAFK